MSRLKTQNEIPKSFKVFDITYNVEIVDDVTNGENLGLVDHELQIIKIQKQIQGVELSKELMYKIFWHEAMHVAFYAIGEMKLRSNERIVDGMAHVVMQILNSAVYDEWQDVKSKKGPAA